MKRIAFSLLCALPLLLVSCEKKYCWKCMTRITIDIPGERSQEATTTTTKCDQTVSEIRKYEKAGTGKTVTEANGAQVYTYTLTMCDQ